MIPQPEASTPCFKIKFIDYAMLLTRYLVSFSSLEDRRRLQRLMVMFLVESRFVSTVQVEKALSKKYAVTKIRSVTKIMS